MGGTDPKIPASDAWCPFADGIEAGERTARLRCLRAIVHLTTGQRGRAAAEALRTAERDPTILPTALAEVMRLAPLDRRRVLASYAVLTRPERWPHA